MNVLDATRPDIVRATASMESAVAPSTDPVTTEVIRHSLKSAAETMKITLRRTAFSPIIYEMIDFCCCLYNDRVELLAQADALPAFLGTMNFCIDGAVAAIGGPENLEPGDILLTTWAYDTGSHAQDAAVIMPVFVDGELVGYSAQKAHHADNGAKAPYCSDTTDVFQEGMIFPGVKIYKAGVKDDDLFRTFVANSRLPRISAGDLSAQIAAAQAGTAAFEAIVEKYGRETFEACVARMFDHGESIVRKALQDLPDGRWERDWKIDGDGLTEEEVPFTVAISIAGGDIEVDVSECAPQAAGPVNSPQPNTVSQARLAVISLVGGGESVNEGFLRPITVTTRPGTLLHPVNPAPIFLYGFTGVRMVEGIHAVLVDAFPAIGRANTGGDILPVLIWGDLGTESSWATGFDHFVGQGAGETFDGGRPLMHMAVSGIRNTPAEVIEQRYPLLIEHFELAPDSGGAGEFAGGLGINCEYRVRKDAVMTTSIEGVDVPPYGAHGGENARVNGVFVTTPDGETNPYRKITSLPLPAGSLVRVQTGGGGGFGPPGARDPEAVKEELRLGYITPEFAQIHYPQVVSK
jgi:N-methylhydantoinase B